MITLSCAVRASICQRMHFIAPSMLLLRICSVPRLQSCNSNLLTCTFLLCNLLKRMHLCTYLRKQIAQFFFYYALCSYSRISRLLTFSFFKSVVQLHESITIPKKEEKVLLTKNLAVANALLHSYVFISRYILVCAHLGLRMASHTDNGCPVRKSPSLQRQK